MPKKNLVVSSLISLSKSIVELISRSVDAEESEITKSDTKTSQPHASSAGSSTGHASEPADSKESQPSKSVPTAPQSDQRQMGTDIDHDAGSVDWSAVKSTGTNWVYCKVSGGFSNTGYDFQDPGFANYWPQLEQAKLARGTYCFFDLNADGKTQAQLFLKLLNAAGGLKADDLPPCLDIEWTPSPSNVPFPSNNQWQEEALAWLSYVEQETGRIPIIYTGLSMAQNNFDSRFSKYPLWVARYPTEDTITPTLNPYPNYAPDNVGPWKNWIIWQYSESGIISGIGPGQDLDILVGTVQDLVAETTVK